MKKLYLGVIISIAISGCATTKGWEQVMQSWVGDNISDYMTTNTVVPTQVIDNSSGGKIYQFSHSATSYYTMPSTTTTSVYGYGNYASGTATTTGGSTIPITSSCVWMFTTDSYGTITNWSYRGNACRAKPIKQTKVSNSQQSSTAKSAEQNITDLAMGDRVALKNEPYNLFKETSMYSDLVQRIYKYHSLTVINTANEWVQVKVTAPRERETQGWVKRSWIDKF